MAAFITILVIIVLVLVTTFHASTQLMLAMLALVALGCIIGFVAWMGRNY